MYVGGPGFAHAGGAVEGASAPPAEINHAMSFHWLDSLRQKERYWIGTTDVSVSVCAARRP